VGLFRKYPRVGVCGTLAQYGGSRDHSEKLNSSHKRYMRGVCTVGEIYINTPALSHIGVDEVDKEYDRKYLSYEGEDGGGCGVEYSYSYMALTSYSYMALMDEGKEIYI
jgi:hypothetical protein